MASYDVNDEEILFFVFFDKFLELLSCVFDVVKTRVVGQVERVIRPFVRDLVIADCIFNCATISYCVRQICHSLLHFAFFGLSVDSVICFDGDLDQGHPRWDKLYRFLLLFQS